MNAKACAIFSAIDFVSANEMFVITATTSPRSGNAMRYVVPPMNSSLLPWIDPLDIARYGF